MAIAAMAGGRLSSSHVRQLSQLSHYAMRLELGCAGQSKETPAVPAAAAAVVWVSGGGGGGGADHCHREVEEGSG